MDKLKKSFQDHMPGNVCFGCGKDNHDGLRIDSYWEGDKAICEWRSEEKYQGWKGILNGGVLATLIDCHSMGTAMAHTYRQEGREPGSFPEYRYATGTLNIKYLKPTSNLEVVRLEVEITENKSRKVTMSCEVFSNQQLTAVAEIIAIRVYDESNLKSSPFNQ